MPGQKILIVEDDTNVRKALADYLIANGFDDVVTAVNGTEGLTCARGQKPDLIISDINMPQMDGYTFIQELRNDVQLKDVPVLVLTGRGEMVDLFRLAEIHNYLIKPFEPRLLLEKVRKMLGRQEKTASAGSEILLEKMERFFEEKEQRPSSRPKPLLELIKEILGKKKIKE